MGIYLKKFETQSAYEAAQSGLILPNVSLTVDNNTVHYNPITSSTPSHDYVEIGGIKWATMNVGANSITDTGLYFQWGDTQGYTPDQVGDDEGKKYFDWEDYKYAELDTIDSNGSGSSNGSNGGTYKMTKYNKTDSKTVLEASDDAVKANWGGNWRMPTVSEFQLLGSSVNTVWTNNYNNSGVAGMVCTDKTDSSKVLFFPAVALCYHGNIDGDISGQYWSSSLNSYAVEFSYNLGFDSDYVNWHSNNNRDLGYSVRGVLSE